MRIEDGLLPERAELVRRIGRLWRGDWSGHVFDGRDGQRWLDTAMNGDVNDLVELADELDHIEGVDEEEDG